MKTFRLPSPPLCSDVLGGEVTTLISGPDHSGACGMMEATLPPGTGTPRHVHSREDEYFYVVEGTAEFSLGEETLTAGTGSCVFGPRGVPHAYRNAGDGPLKMICVYVPGGFEQSFAESDGMTGREIMGLLAEYGVSPA